MMPAKISLFRNLILFSEHLHFLDWLLIPYVYQIIHLLFCNFFAHRVLASKTHAYLSTRYSKTK